MTDRSTEGSRWQARQRFGARVPTLRHSPLAAGADPMRNVACVFEMPEEDPAGDAGAARGGWLEWLGLSSDREDDLGDHPVVDQSRRLAVQMLGDTGTRWQHTRGVAARAAELTPVVSADERPLLVAAAWLHDIGHAQPLLRSGFRALDGAWYLREQGFGELLAGLVAHRSGARFVAAESGLGHEMAAFDDPRCWTGRLADALTAADQTTGLDGRPMDVEARLADMRERHGPDSPQARAHHLRAPAVRVAVAHSEHRLLAVRLASAFA